MEDALPELPKPVSWVFLILQCIPCGVTVLHGISSWTDRYTAVAQQPGLYSDVLKPGAGYGIALATASHRYHPFRLELIVFLIRKWKGPSMDFSIHWNLFWPRIVPWDTGIVDLALCGDVDPMKGEFSKGIQPLLMYFQTA